MILNEPVWVVAWDRAIISTGDIPRYQKMAASCDRREALELYNKLRMDFPCGVLLFKWDVRSGLTKELPVLADDVDWRVALEHDPSKALLAMCIDKAFSQLVHDLYAPIGISVTRCS